jgi:hypothetical protein
LPFDNIDFANRRRQPGNSAREVGYGEEDAMGKSLVTIEDCYRAAKILENPDSIPQRYVVEDRPDLGYCTSCREITLCELGGLNAEFDVRCKRCKGCFGVGPLHAGENLYIRDVSKMPVTEAIIKELTELFPREKQKEAFIKKLKEFIEWQEKEVAKYKGKYRAARKNVTRGNKLLAAFQ